MFERSRIKVPFGGGIDRASGLVAVQPGDFLDLRNLQLYEGKSQARQGVEVRSTITVDNNGSTPVDDVSFLSAFRAVRLGLVVGYWNVTRQVQVFVTAATGLNPQLVDTTGANSTWGTLALDAGRPRVFGVEAQKFFFLAHDQPLFSRRLLTRYYNPAAGAGSRLVTLTANLDNSGSSPISFRGVMTHLAYLVGWGYGSATDADRPEIVRMSKPGEPLVFVPEHYFIIGTRGEPVLNCKTVGNNLLVFKETEIHAITGYDRATFGIQPVDANYGLAGSHLAVVVEGICYFWSLHGPRATDGGPSKDLGYPLDVSAAATGRPGGRGRGERRLRVLQPGEAAGRVLLRAAGLRPPPAGRHAPVDLQPLWHRTPLRGAVLHGQRDGGADRLSRHRHHDRRGRLDAAPGVDERGGDRR